MLTRMPPKKDQPSKKTIDKQKDRIVEDKTFGLKNKKGKKQQQYVSHVTTQVKFSDKSYKDKVKQDAEKKATKDALTEREEELKQLFKPVLKAQSICAGADPKSIVCAFFKQGQCKKGDKCKFSHDLSIERNVSAKRSAFVDLRDVDDEKLENDTMDKWDQDKLEMVVAKKDNRKDDKVSNRTTIICKYFLNAVEKGMYGWFWECPNGSTCIYRHALPPGYVLQREKKAMEAQKDDEITIEELVEKERSALNSQMLTPVTEDSFKAWKLKKRKEADKKQTVETAKKKDNFKTGTTAGVTGREMFAFNPDMVKQDDDEADMTVYLPPAEVDGEVAQVSAVPLDVPTTDAIFGSLQESSDEDSGDDSDLNLDQLNLDPQPVENGLDHVEIDQDLFLAESVTLDELD